MEGDTFDQHSASCAREISLSRHAAGDTHVGATCSGDPAGYTPEQSLALCARENSWYEHAAGAADDVHVGTTGSGNMDGDTPDQNLASSSRHISRSGHAAGDIHAGTMKSGDMDGDTLDQYPAPCARGIPKPGHAAGGTHVGAMSLGNVGEDASGKGRVPHDAVRLPTVIQLDRLVTAFGHPPLGEAVRAPKVTPEGRKLLSAAEDFLTQALPMFREATGKLDLATTVEERDHD